jgi:hypothetical protein
MATLQSGSSPKQRVEVGDAIFAAAKSVDIKPIAKRFGDFSKVHAAYRGAAGKVEQANIALGAQQAKIAEADVDQDEAVLDLASALAGDGLPRQNPFKPLGTVAPAQLCKLGFAAEATEVLALEKAVLKRKVPVRPAASEIPMDADLNPALGAAPTRSVLLVPGAAWRAARARLRHAHGRGQAAREALSD